MKGDSSNAQGVVSTDRAGRIGAKNGGIDKGSVVLKQKLVRATVSSNPRLGNLVSGSTSCDVDQISTLTAVDGAALEICGISEIEAVVTTVAMQQGGAK